MGTRQYDMDDVEESEWFNNEHTVALRKTISDLMWTTKELENGVALTRKVLLNVAIGCHDYGGGHREEKESEAFHHGIQTVINALEAAIRDPDNHQVKVLQAIGSASCTCACGIPGSTSYGTDAHGILCSQWKKPESKDGQTELQRDWFTLCPPHRNLWRAGHLEQPEKCLACIRNERNELRMVQGTGRNRQDGR